MTVVEFRLSILFYFRSYYLCYQDIRKMSSKKTIRLWTMTHDQFHTYLRDTFGEKIRTLVIDELDIPSPRIIIDMNLQFDIMERVESMQEELKLKFVKEKEISTYQKVRLCPCWRPFNVILKPSNRSCKINKITNDKLQV